MEDPMTEPEEVYVNGKDHLHAARAGADADINIVPPADEIDVASLKKGIKPPNRPAVPLGIAVGRPKPLEYFRTHPDPEYAQEFLGYDIEVPGTTTKDLYLVDPCMQELLESLGASLCMYRLYTLVTRQSNLIVCPVKLAGDNETGRGNEWHRTRQVAVEKSITEWGRMQTKRVDGSKNAGGYDWIPSPTNYGEPNWPHPMFTVGRIIKLSFGDRNRIIRTPDHPIVRLLQDKLGV
jgi:hypothetical protein